METVFGLRRRGWNTSGLRSDQPLFSPFLWWFLQHPLLGAFFAPLWCILPFLVPKSTPNGDPWASLFGCFSVFGPPWARLGLPLGPRSLFRCPLAPFGLHFWYPLGTFLTTFATLFASHRRHRTRVDLDMFLKTKCIFMCVLTLV